MRDKLRVSVARIKGYSLTPHPHLFLLTSPLSLLTPYSLHHEKALSNRFRRQCPRQETARAVGAREEHSLYHRRLGGGRLRCSYRPRQRSPGGHGEPGLRILCQQRQRHAFDALPRMRSHDTGLHRLPPAAGCAARTGTPQDGRALRRRRDTGRRRPQRPCLRETHQARGHVLLQGRCRTHGQGDGLHLR